MAFLDQSALDVTYEWGIEAVESLAPADVLVVIDVLSFSTSVEAAVVRGATILPYRWPDETAAGLRLLLLSPTGSEIVIGAHARGGRVVERGFTADVEIAAQLDVSDCVPILVEDAFVGASS